LHFSTSVLIVLTKELSMAVIVTETSQIVKMSADSGALILM
jgi:hypothetical protein